MDTVKPLSLRDRFRGAILGTAVGDALGAPFEGRRRVAGSELAAWQAADEPLRWTDDTAMTIGVARSLAACGRFDGDDMARAFVAAYDAEPWRGYGAGPPRVFDALRRGASWDEPARRMFGGQGSFGNGAAMRAAPVGLFAHRDLDAVVAIARDQAAITHSHELARQGAAMQAYGVAWLVATRPHADAGIRGPLLDRLRRVGPAAGYQRQLAALAALDAGASVDAVVAALGHGIAAVEAVPAALHALLRHPGSFADAVAYAVSLGGDCDTIAAMAGALSGALLGEPAIPRAWLERLEAPPVLTDVADRLLATTGPR